MAGTQVRMDRTTTTSNGTNTYEIVATCTVKGTLPDSAIFLLQINTASDPKDDTLVRVVEIADTTLANTNRSAQIAAGNTTWRSNTVLLRYNDIETANAAWQELSARINTLVEQVDTYLAEYSTLPEGQTIVYPRVDPTIEAQLKAEYESAAAAVTTAEAARDAEATDCTQLKKDITVLEDRLTEAQSDLATYTTIQAQLTVFLSTYQTVQPSLSSCVNTVRVINSTSTTPGSAKTDIEAQLTAQDAQLVTFNNNNANTAALRSGPVSSAVSTLQARVASLTTQRNTAQTQYNQCVTRSATLQGAVDAARTARNAALAAVRAVCPDFVP